VTLAQIGALIMTQVDDPTGVSFAPATPPNTIPPEVVNYVNEGQQLAALLTLSFEKTAAFSIGASFSIDANGCFYLPRPVLTDLIVPLRLTYNGNRIRPGTIAEIEAENDAWPATAGTPTRYAMLGFNFLVITPQTTGVVQTTYACSPATLVNDADIPQLLEAYHQNLVDYGVYRVRLKEGAQGLARGLERFNLFLDDMTKLGDYVRARTAAARYDVTPFELALMDRSRLVGQLMNKDLVKGIQSQASMWRRRLQTEKY
jgi:hypothetical protein